MDSSTFLYGGIGLVAVTLGTVCPFCCFLRATWRRSSLHASDGFVWGRRAAMKTRSSLF